MPLLALKNAFLDRQGNPDWAVISGCVMFLAFLCFSYHAYILCKQSFDPVSFGTGSGTIGLGAGANKLMSNKGDYGSKDPE